MATETTRDQKESKRDVEEEKNGELFCLNDYDCIGFDMDHTIVQYHVEELFKVMLRSSTSTCKCINFRFTSSIRMIIHTSINASMSTTIRSLSRTFIRSFVHTFVCTFVRTFFGVFIDTSIPSFILTLFIHSFLHLSIFHSLFYSYIHSSFFFHLLIRWFLKCIC